jgi:galactokinase
MTGGGFGGCIIALCIPAGEGDRIGQQIAAAFAEPPATGPTEWFSVLPAAGAGRLA